MYTCPQVPLDWKPIKNISIKLHSNVTIDQKRCYPKCEGLLISSFVKKDVGIPKDQLETIAKAYQDYKGYYSFPQDAINNYESKLRIIRTRDNNLISSVLIRWHKSKIIHE